MPRLANQLLALLAVALLAAACGSSDDSVGTITLGNGSLTPDDVEAPQTDLESLDPALRLPIADADGNEVALTDYLGRPAVVNLWASWCAFCIAEMPEFEIVFQEVKDEISFVGINIDADADRELADQLAAETGVTYDLLFDTSDQIGQRLGSIAMPATAFIDSAGEIINVHNGQLTEESLREMIDDLLS